MRTKNKVIAGEYSGADVTLVSGKAALAISLGKMILLNQKMVAAYEVISESKGIHTVSVIFSDGKKSLMEMDDKIFRVFLTELF